MILHKDDYEIIKHFFKICLNNIKFTAIASFKNINTVDYDTIKENINPQYLVLEAIPNTDTFKINMKYQKTILGFKDVELKTSDDIILREFDILTMLYEHKELLKEVTEKTYTSRNIDCMGYVALVNLYVKKFLPLLGVKLRTP